MICPTRRPGRARAVVDDGAAGNAPAGDGSLGIGSLKG